MLNLSYNSICQYFSRFFCGARDAALREHSPDWQWWIYVGYDEVGSNLEVAFDPFDDYVSIVLYCCVLLMVIEGHRLFLKKRWSSSHVFWYAMRWKSF